MEFVDTHCHIHFDNYGLPVDKVMADAAATGVKRMILVGCTLADSAAAVELATRYKNVWTAVGVHPHEAANLTPTNLQGLPLQVREMCYSRLNKVVAIGEIGLDYYHENSSKADQEKLLRLQIEAGLDSDLPFIFHVRDAFKDFWPIFDEYKIEKAVIHSFSAGPKVLDQILSRGLYVGLNGIMTFTRDESQLAAAKLVPLDRMLLETDAPFLTPKPHRGDICEPKHVGNTAEFLAKLRGESLETIAKATTTNAERLFGIRR